MACDLDGRREGEDKMRIDPGSVIDRAIIRLFFTSWKNTNQIAKQMDMPEWRVDRVIAREMDRRWKA